MVANKTVDDASVSFYSPVDSFPSAYMEILKPFALVSLLHQSRP